MLRTWRGVGGKGECRFHFSHRGIESATRNGQNATVATDRITMALNDLELGALSNAMPEADAALKLSSEPSVKIAAAFLRARAGSTAAALQAAHELETSRPLDTMLKYYALPAIRAATALSQGKPQEAVESLQVSAGYELGAPDGLGQRLYPAYLRGLALLSLRRGTEAAVEFRKITGRPEFMMNDPLVPCLIWI